MTTALELPRIRLETKPDPADTARTLGPTYPQLPFVVLVAADLTHRSDARPVEDRHPRIVTRDTFDAVMAAQRIAVEVALPRARVTFTVRGLADLAPDAVAQQIATALSIGVDDARAALGAVFADPRMAAIERVWRGIRRLVDEAGEHALVEVLNVSAEDLDADFDDAPELRKSGLWRLVHAYNHLGMRPYGAIVLPDDLGSAARRIRDIGEIAARAHAVVLADGATPEEPSPGHAVWRCARVEGSGAFVQAALMLKSHARHLMACHFAEGCLDGVEMANPTTPDDAPSLSVLLFGNRIIHEALNVHWRRALGRNTSLSGLVVGMNEGLAARLGHTGLVATVEAEEGEPGYRWIDMVVRFTHEGVMRRIERRFTVPDEW